MRITARTEVKTGGQNQGCTGVREELDYRDALHPLSRILSLLEGQSWKS